MPHLSLMGVWNAEHQRMVSPSIPDMDYKAVNNCQKLIACNCCVKYGSCKAPVPKIPVTHAHVKRVTCPKGTPRRGGIFQTRRRYI